MDPKNADGKVASAGGPDPAHKASAEGDRAGAGKSLDELLASWDEEAKSGTGDGKKADPGEEGRVKALLDRISALERDAADRSYQADIGSVVAKVKGDLDVDDFIVESWVNRRAESDERLTELWKNRDTRKRQLDQALDVLKDEFAEWAKERGQGGKGRPEDASRKLASAVKNAREAPGNGQGGDLDSLNWAAMSDTEFALKSAEVIRLAEAGRLS